MDSDESGHNKSEFYYPEEETVNQITPINRDDVDQDRHLNNIQDFIYSLRFDNTKKKTTYDLNIWQRYCSTVGETRALENIPPEELNILLCRFFMDVGIKDVRVLRARLPSISSKKYSTLPERQQLQHYCYERQRVCQIEGGTLSSQTRLGS